MFSDFPNLHPLVVHFPIVLILLSAVLQAWLVLKPSPQLRWGTLIIMGAAFASAVVASKVFHAHTLELPPVAQAIYQDHEKYSAYTLWISGLTFLLRGIGEFYHLRRRSFEGLVLASALVAAVFLSLTGHRGAQLVYLEGVGPQGNLVMTGDHGQEHGGTTPATNHPMPAAPGGHPGHGDPASGQQPPAGHDKHEQGTPDHGSGHAGKPAMPGMNHSPGAKPGSGQSHAPGMAGMDHSQMQSAKTKAKGKEEMAGMDHSQMQPAKTKAKGNEGMAGMDHSQMQPANKPVPDHAAMGHGTTPALGNQPRPGSMPGMDHGAMPAAGQQPVMDHAGGKHAGTDPYGRPLIDPTVPYDNNPARELASPRPKKQ
ncbi:MAG: DUF2231 domain-containing protein [Adhaeribacter sp.]